MELMTLLWLILGIFVFIITVFVVIFIWYLRVYKFKVELYEDLGGKGFERVAIYRARKLIIRGSVADAVLWVPKAKTYCSAYGRKMGKNLYWQVVGPDGLWYNAVLGEFDTKTGVLDVEVVNRDVRAFHTTNQKNIRERYDKPKNWPIVLMSFTIVIALIILVGGAYFIIDKMNEGLEQSAANNKAAAETSQAVINAAAKVVESLDNIGVTELVKLTQKIKEEGDSGLKPAT